MGFEILAVVESGLRSSGLWHIAVPTYKTTQHHNKKYQKPQSQQLVPTGSWLTC
jgi:hypothetical protein